MVGVALVWLWNSLKRLRLVLPQVEQNARVHCEDARRLVAGFLRAVVRARWAVTASSSFQAFFPHDFIHIYWNNRVIIAYQCTNHVDLPWRSGAGPVSVRCYKHQVLRYYVEDKALFDTWKWGKRKQSIITLWGIKLGNNKKTKGVFLSNLQNYYHSKLDF